MPAGTGCTRGVPVGARFRYPVEGKMDRSLDRDRTKNPGLREGGGIATAGLGRQNKVQLWECAAVRSRMANVADGYRLEEETWSELRYR
jgi:hypothetical protein